VGGPWRPVRCTAPGDSVGTHAVVVGVAVGVVALDRGMDGVVDAVAVGVTDGGRVAYAYGIAVMDTVGT